MRQTWCRATLLIGAVCSLVASAESQDGVTVRLPVQSDAWIEPRGIAGALMLDGGEGTPDVILNRFVKLAGDDKARVVIVDPQAGARTSSGRLRKRKIESVAIFKEGVQGEFLDAVQHATGVWFDGSVSKPTIDSDKSRKIWQAVNQLLRRGGVVRLHAEATAAAGVRTLGNTRGGAQLGLLPDAIVVPKFEESTSKPALLEALSGNPGLVGFGIDEETALVVNGRLMQVVGNGNVNVFLSGSSDRPVYEHAVEHLGFADLTALRRAARARTLPTFPPNKPGAPNVPAGTLVVVGGGALPDVVTERFLHLAGGRGALIVVLPTAIPELMSSQIRVPQFLSDAGATNVRVLKARRREDVESDEFLDVLNMADAIWFTGGRQWRIVDAYEGTKAFPAIRGVLERGGVIGGSSAGASIQAEYLARGNPLGNADIMAEGYERGFAFLPGTAVDQHFSQRNRFADMLMLVKRFPQLLGIGIDESTALIVRQHHGEVLGAGSVYFYDSGAASQTGEPAVLQVEGGGVYDLIERRAVEPLATAE